MPFIDLPWMLEVVLLDHARGAKEKNLVQHRHNQLFSEPFRAIPPLSGPSPHAGFGSKLITMLFEGQLGGVVNKRWEPTGLVCEMSFPFRGAI